ncbi:HAD family hydrolase [Heyndrickxia coagulans]|uniref:HAD family hydrolase n=1 Tax=Heyndrickxia coagulans TaxID=1398 RepID=UPI000375CBF3|nr:HAD-IIB family hydrolase [Heyndrickxia coagulans]
MEVTNKGISKGKALDIIMEKYGIRDDEIVVFGDSENDISMFNRKKYSITMANALPNAKQFANYLTDSHNQEGIFNMLVRLEKEGLFEENGFGY